MLDLDHFAIGTRFYEITSLEVEETAVAWLCACTGILGNIECEGSVEQTGDVGVTQTDDLHYLVEFLVHSNASSRSNEESLNYVWIYKELHHCLNFLAKE